MGHPNVGYREEKRVRFSWERDKDRFSVIVKRQILGDLEKTPSPFMRGRVDCGS
jgi:hypothetical protein